MSSIPPSSGPARRATAPGDQRPSIVMPAALVGILIVGGAIAYKVFQSAPPPASPAPVVDAAAQRPAVRAIAPRAETGDGASALAAAAPIAAPPGTAVKPAPAPVAPVEPSVDSRQLMVSLASLDPKAPISAEEAQKWKESLQQLARGGASSVPAIREYLAQNLDVSYAGVQGADQLGFSSLRSGLLNALGQIGGPESTAAMLQTMQSSIFPSDIAAIATTLEQQAPGQYQNEVLSAVRSQLAQASQDQLGNANVGPLYQLLATAGANGTDVSADLSQYASKWPYYASIEMANLPNGAGIPSLVQMAQNDNGSSQSAAAQALAQLAPQNSQAMTALLNMAQQGQLSDATLAQLAPYLGGRENQLGPVDNPSGSTTQGIHLAYGNQDYSASDLLNALTPAQVAQRISIIDQLLQDIPPSDTQAQQALQQQKIGLSSRPGK